MKKIIFTICFLPFISLAAQNGKVGINTQTPAETLDVNGKTHAKAVFLRNPGEPQESGGTFLASANSAVNTSMQRYPSDKKLFNYFNLTFNNVNNDGIADYNTKVSTTEFILVVHNYSFQTSSGTTNVSLDYTTGQNNRQSSPDIATFKGADGFWHIRARFPNSKFVNGSGASADANDRFTIKLYMVAYRYLITKQNIPNQSTNLGGTDGSGTTYAIPKPNCF